MSPRHRLVAELERARVGWKAATDEAAALRRRVRQYAKALRIARSLTGWATSSDVDAQIRAALAPLPKRAATKRGRKR